MQKFTVQGARGGRPACGEAFVRYGGHTTCFSLENGNGILIFDAGTGISTLSDEVLSRGDLPPLTLLFTHFHMDHVIGIPFFNPLYEERAHITLMASSYCEKGWIATLSSFLGRPFWPVDLCEVPAHVEFKDLAETAGGLTLNGVRLSWCPLSHTQPSLAYRLETPDRVIVIATDHEPGHAEADARLAKFTRGADYLFCDAQYTPEEYPAYRGWGHGTWQGSVELAQQAGVSHLLLTHHDPRRTDDEIDAIVAQARQVFPCTEAAREGMTLTV